MIVNQLGDSRRVLLLQGPMGKFFAELAKHLAASGKQVHKVNFNSGDALYYPSGTPYRGRLADWPAWLELFCRESNIDSIIVFGDCRAYHRMAKEVARDLNLQFFVFEEGYLRPNWITFEPWGVNGHSSVSSDPAHYTEQSVQGLEEVKEIEPIDNRYFYRAMVAITYYVVTLLGMFSFWHYQHHRKIAVSEAYRWIRSGVRKLWYSWRQRHILPKLLAQHDKHFYLFPLQVHNDSQLWFHAGNPMASYIDQVIASFAAHAPADTVLVIKHHPMDRAYRDYSSLIRVLSQGLGVSDRVLYVHDLHLPTLLDHARAVVAVNSTVGLTAVFRGLPVKTLGRAIYDMPGLTNQLSLDQFWQTQQPVDLALAKRFKLKLMHTCQLRGCVYAKNPLVDPRLRGLSLVVNSRLGQQAG